MKVETKDLTLFEKTKAIMRSDEVIEKFAEVLGSERSARKYIGSVILAVGQSDKLQECSPQSIMISGMRAATLKLTVDPSLGHAYMVPYGGKATFILGYKGLMQLALRTGKYRFINVATIYNGQKVEEDQLRGIHSIKGMPATGKDRFPIGYMLYFELRDGYSKTFYMTSDEITAHAKKYSKSYSRSDSLWKTDFENMAKKTVIRLGLSKYGYFDADDYLAMNEPDDIDMEDQFFDDDYIDGELLDSAIEQEEERIQELVGGKTTEELSAMLGFDVVDRPPTPSNNSHNLVDVAIAEGGKIATEDEAVQQYSRNTMSLETAEAVTSRDGTRYGDLPTDKLAYMANTIQKTMKKNGVNHEKHEEHQMKLDAIRVILSSRDG